MIEKIFVTVKYSLSPPELRYLWVRFREMMEKVEGQTTSNVFIQDGKVFRQHIYLLGSIEVSVVSKKLRGIRLGNVKGYAERETHPQMAFA